MTADEQLKVGQVVGYIEKPKLACVVKGFWYGVCTEYRQEKLAVGDIAAAGLVVFWPRVPHIQRHGRGKERSVLRSMFPGYMLVKCDPTWDHWGWVTSARGVKRLLGIDGPQKIPDEAIEVIRLHETEEAERETERLALEAARKRAQEKGRSGVVWDFAPDERVRIKHGPFKGFYAQLTTAVDVHDRVKALLSLFGGRSEAEISAFDLEPLAESS